MNLSGVGGGWPALCSAPGLFGSGSPKAIFFGISPSLSGWIITSWLFAYA
jgi:hypothetical protein